MDWNLNKNFWRRFLPIKPLKGDEEVAKALKKFDVEKLLRIFSLTSKTELVSLAYSNENVRPLLTFVSNYGAGITEYYGLEGNQKERNTSAVDVILKDKTTLEDNPNNPLLIALLLHLARESPVYRYALEQSSPKFREKIFKDLEKRRRLILALHRQLGKDYYVEHVVGNKDLIVIYITRKKGKKVIPKHLKTILNSHTTGRVIVIDWKNNKVRIPRYNRKEINFLLNFFKFNVKLGIKTFDYAQTPDPSVPENILDQIHEIKTNRVEQLNGSIYLKSEGVEPLSLNECLKDQIRGLKYSKIRTLSVIKDGEKIDMKMVSGNDFYFRPAVVSPQTDETSLSNFFGVDVNKKHLKFDKNNIEEEITRLSLDRLKIREIEHPKIKDVINKLIRDNILDYFDDEKRICTNKECDFRGAISYRVNRKYRFLCPNPKCRQETVFMEEVITLVPKLRNIVKFSEKRLKKFKESNSFPLDITEKKLSMKDKKKRKSFPYIEVFIPDEREKRMNLFFADRKTIDRIRDYASSQIVPYRIILVEPIQAKDDRELKLSDFYLGIRTEKGPKYVLDLFENVQKYDKWREEIIEIALRDMESIDNWGKFEDSVFICFQYLFPACVKLGKKYTGKKYPDGYGRFVEQSKERMFGWDAKFTQATYSFNESPSKHYAYMDYLNRLGHLKYYFIVSNNLPETSFRAVFDKRRRYELLTVSYISSKLLKELITLVRREGYNLLDLDLRSKILSILFKKMDRNTNYLDKFELIKPEIMAVIDEKKKRMPSPARSD